MSLLESQIARMASELPIPIEELFRADASAGQEDVTASSTRPEDCAQRIAERKILFRANETIRSICHHNNIGVEAFCAEHPAVCRLELCHFSLPTASLSGIDAFSRITELVILVQDITDLRPLGACVELRRLHVCETKVTHITGLENLVKLQHLFLYGNCISKIEGLTTLVALEELWLNDNRIAVIEGLETLKSLRYVQLSDNRITTVGRGLIANQSLEYVGLAGNLLSSLREITQFTQLPKLKHLVLQDVNYRPSQISVLLNYQIHTIFNLPQLEHLDSIKITRESRKLIESTLSKKRLFYNMRIRTAQRNQHILARYNAQRHLSATASTRAQLAVLYASLTCLPADSVEVRHQLDALIEQRLALMVRHEAFRDTVNRRLVTLGQFALKELMLEIESGGNVRVQLLAAHHEGYQACAKLLQSCPAFYDPAVTPTALPVIHRVSKIHHRFVKSQLDAALSGAEGPELVPRHVFAIARCPDAESPSDEPETAPEQLYGALEFAVLHPTFQVRSEITSDMFPIAGSRYYLIVSRCYARDGQATTLSHDAIGSFIMDYMVEVYVPYPGQVQPDVNQLSRISLLDPVFPSVPFLEDVASPHDDAPIDMHELLQCLTQDHPALEALQSTAEMIVPMAQMLFDQSELLCRHGAMPNATTENAPPEPASWPMILAMHQNPMNNCFLTPASPLDHANNLANPNLITRLELGGCGLTNLDLFPPSMPSLRHLGLARNRLSAVDELMRYPLLTHADLQLNRLTSIDVLGDHPHLSRLSIDENVVSEVCRLPPSLKFLSARSNGLSAIRLGHPANALSELYLGDNAFNNFSDVLPWKSWPRLVILDLAENDVITLPNYRFFLIFHLVTLKVLDGLTISRSEQESGQELFKGRLTIELLEQKLASMDGPTTQLNLSNQQFREIECFKAAAWVDLAPLWGSLRSLTLDNNQLTHLSGLVALTGLRSLSVRCNRITKLFPCPSRRGDPLAGSKPSLRNGSSGAASLARPSTGTPRAKSPTNSDPNLCSDESYDAQQWNQKVARFAETIEELHLDGNMLSTLQDMSPSLFTRLRILRLERNRITVLDASLSKMALLVELDLNYNKIRTIHPSSLSSLRNLLTLLLKGNCIKTIEPLENLASLATLDLAENRIGDMLQIEKLQLSGLTRIWVVKNPVWRTKSFRYRLIHHFPQLTMIDGKDITMEERQRSEIFMAEQTRSFSIHPQDTIEASGLSMITMDASQGGMGSLPRTAAKPQREESPGVSIWSVNSTPPAVMSANPNVALGVQTLSFSALAALSRPANNARNASYRPPHTGMTSHVDFGAASVQNEPLLSMYQKQQILLLQQQQQQHMHVASSSTRLGYSGGMMAASGSGSGSGSGRMHGSREGLAETSASNGNLYTPNLSQAVKGHTKALPLGSRRRAGSIPSMPAAGKLWNAAAPSPLPSTPLNTWVNPYYQSNAHYSRDR
ncbi:hypothetical protein CXG81DRAFT_19107 [Caulochytrium protostelioides]|uniref:Protein phosphatase 1 regulatory subunit 7 n=1 Tax=Caulochytrium protostelioides TaxID=1555241 RepID=A0A4P9X770_9FUNG|nr:hypothetical protein CXG81DRAFT_19107 [Caulochytrium protostelioides]|eukprot:RKP01063.1 hypothetical protein CXG81DRAFT_19107 [Caulochytrium protostelioides]